MARFTMPTLQAQRAPARGTTFHAKWSLRTKLAVFTLLSTAGKVPPWQNTLPQVCLEQVVTLNF